MNDVIKNAPSPFNTMLKCCDNLDIEVGLGINDDGFVNINGLSLRCNSCNKNVCVDRDKGYRGLVEKWGIKNEEERQ